MAQSFFPVSPILVDLRCLSRVVTSKEEMMPNKEVAHSKVLIVGGSSGMGLALARRCLDSGARVVIAGRSEAKLRNASRTLRPHGVPDMIAVDVTQEEQVEPLFSQVGQLDHIVSTAADIEGAYQLLQSGATRRREILTTRTADRCVRSHCGTGDRSSSARNRLQ